MTSRFVVLGGPGDGVVVAEAILQSGEAGADCRLVGFLNDALPVGSLIHGAPVLGRFEDWPSLPDDALLIPAVHKVRDMPARIRRLRSLHIPEERWGTVRHPTACVASNVVLGYGCFLASFVTVQPGARIGRFATLRAGASVGHDAIVSDFAYMGPNSTLCGRACLHEAAHLGPNAVVLDGKEVGPGAVVGIGSAVTKNVPEYTVISGNPGRPVGRVSTNG